MWCVEYYSGIEKKRMLPSSINWTDLEGIMLSEISQRKTNTIRFHLYVEYKKQNNLLNTENNLVVTKAEVG